MLKTIMHSLSIKPDAISLLKKDHQHVDALFKQFEKEDDKRRKLTIAKQICLELTVHDRLESRIFYPQTKTAAGKGGEATVDAVNEGIVEHEAIRALIEEIPKLAASDEFFETRVTVLMEYVKHHVREEENSMFPKVIESDIDLVALGERMQDAKRRYQEELGMPAEQPSQLEKLVDAAKEKGEEATNALAQTAESVKDRATDAAASIEKRAKTAVRDAKQKVSDVTAAAKSRASEKAEDVSSALSETADAVKGKATGAAASIERRAKSVVQATKQKASGATTIVKAQVAEKAAGVRKQVGDARAKAASTLNGAVQAGKDSVAGGAKTAAKKSAAGGSNAPNRNAKPSATAAKKAAAPRRAPAARKKA